MDRTIEDAAAEYHRPPEAPREDMWRRIEAARRGTPAATVLPFRRRTGRFVLPIGVAALLALAFGLGRFTADGTEPAPIAVDVRSAPADQSPVLAATPADSGKAGAAPAPERHAVAAATEPVESRESRAAGGSPRRAAAPETGSDPAARSSGPDAGGSDALAMAARQHLAQAESFLVLFRASVSSGQRVEPVVPSTARYLLASNRLLIDSPAAEDPIMRRLLGDVELVLAQIAQMPADSADTTDETLITQSIEQRDLLLRIRSAAGDARGMPNQGVL